MFLPLCCNFTFSHSLFLSVIFPTSLSHIHTLSFSLPHPYFRRNLTVSIFFPTSLSLSLCLDSSLSLPLNVTPHALASVHQMSFYLSPQSLDVQGPFRVHIGKETRQTSKCLQTELTGETVPFNCFISLYPYVLFWHRLFTNKYGLHCLSFSPGRV